MIDVSILIVHYKTLDLTTACIRSIVEHTKGVSFEIIVIDNDSQDGAKALIVKEFTNIRWLEMGYNSGFARANNAGIKAANGRYIALLNSDTLLLDDMFSIAVQRMDSSSDVAACGGVQLYENQAPRPFFRSLAAFRRFQFVYPPSAFIEKILLKCYPDNIYKDPEEVDWIPAAFLMARRSVIDRVGMLDEQFFMYGEDVEWNCRLKTAGRLLVYENCRYIHYEWGSDKKAKEQKITPINRLIPKITVPNLVWTRNQYGIGAFLVLMVNYYIMLGVYYLWKIIVNLKNGQNPFTELENQHDYAQKLRLISSYFWKILFKRKHFYKIV